MKKVLLFTFLAGSTFAADTMLYMGVWPNQVLAIDEHNYQIAKRIDLKTDVPRSLALTADRSKLIVMTLKNTGIETIDLTKEEVIDSFTLGDNNTRVSMAGMVVDPTGSLLYSNITTSKKLIDRWEIGYPKLSVIDLKQHKILKEVEIPVSDREQAAGGYRGGNYRVSPDGKYLYQFGRAIAIYDTSTLKKVQTIDLAKPTFPGMENVTFAPEVDPNDDDNTLTGVFNTEDPEVHRKVFGVATFHLNERKFDFTPIGPAVEGVSNIRYTPDHKTAYAVAITGTHGDRHCEFWGIDVPSTKLRQRQEFACRPRFSFASSSNGQELFIYSAGFELEVYDSATMKLQKTLSMDADITTPMVTVLAGNVARASR
jgi:DNA-binding beta-propeller fold protein YncE